MKYILIILLTLTIVVSCSTNKPETKVVRLHEINDYKDFQEWGLKGNGPTHKDENLDKMTLDHYIDLINQSEVYYNHGLNNLTGVYLKTGANRLTLLLNDSGQTIIIEVERSGTTFSIIKTEKK